MKILHNEKVGNNQYYAFTRLATVRENCEAGALRAP